MTFHILNPLFAKLFSLTQYCWCQCVFFVLLWQEFVALFDGGLSHRHFLLGLSVLSMVVRHWFSEVCEFIDRLSFWLCLSRGFGVSVSD